MGMFIGDSVFSGDDIDSFKSEAIEHRCAQYNPNTGEFEWLK